MVRLIGIVSLSGLLLAASGARAGAIATGIDPADLNDLDRRAAAAPRPAVAEVLAPRPLDAALEVGAVASAVGPTEAVAPGSSGDEGFARPSDRGQPATSAVAEAGGERSGEVLAATGSDRPRRVAASPAVVDVPTAAAPEPPIFALMGTCLVGLFFRTRILQARQAALDLAKEESPRERTEEVRLVPTGRVTCG